MSERAQKPWSVKEFFAWQEGREERYELVNGFPARMMTGARNVHDDIVVNIVVELGIQLRGSGCRPFTADGRVETRPGQIRRPDVGVDCGPRDPDDYKAALPRLIVEVLSPSARDFDTFGKLDEYKGLPSLAYILLIEPNAPMVAIWFRDADRSWQERRSEGLDGNVDLPELSLTLPLRAIYEDINLASP
ncbi:MAG: Uma2 family endonuclease [Pseudomonadota bacterium]|nr:Uma2 family endonuclease [Pseudomonadota bacterium]